MTQLGNGLVYYLVFLVSATVHEAAHAWAAKRGGDPTAYLGGQVSLDPRPHIRREPFGMVVLPLLSVAVSGWPFGFASAPYDPRWAMRYPRRAALMALAGPASNLILVLAMVVLMRIGVAAGVFFPPESVGFGRVTVGVGGGVWHAAGFVVSVVFCLNVLLAALNLLPVPPLDGSAAIPLVLSEPTANRYQQFIWGRPALAWVGLLIAWQLFDRIIGPVFLFAVNLIYPGVSYG